MVLDFGRKLARDVKSHGVLAARYYWHALERHILHVLSALRDFWGLYALFCGPTSVLELHDTEYLEHLNQSPINGCFCVDQSSRLAAF